MGYSLGINTDHNRISIHCDIYTSMKITERVSRETKIELSVGEFGILLVLAALSLGMITYKIVTILQAPL